MNDYATQLIANEDRLSVAWGRTIPELTESTQADADRAFELDTENLKQEKHPWFGGGSSHWLGSLAAAWLKHQDERYPLAAAAVYRSVLAQEPLTEGQWAPKRKYNSLLIPHRIGDTECVGWLGALPWFLDHETFQDGLFDQIISSVRGQLNYLADHLHEGRNIRATQGDALFSSGLRLSFLDDAENWKQAGLDVVNDMFHRMIRADGSSAEATGWYHYIIMNMGLRLWRLGQSMPELGVQVRREQVERMLDYTCAVVEPDGRLTTIGDCTRSRIGSDGNLESVLERRSWARTVLGVDECPLPVTQVFPDSGQAYLRDGWEADSMMVTFDATRRHGYHWHPSCNSIQVICGDQPIVVDPGRMSYDGNSPHRQYAISTRGHSTCNLNGWNQTWTNASFRARSAPGYDVIDSFYDSGYWPSNDEFNPQPGIFGHHHRTLVWIRDRFLVVFDHVHHRQSEAAAPDIECNWQFAPGSVEVTGDDRAVATHGKRRHLLLMPVLPEGATLSVHDGAENPHLGWVSDDGDQPQPAPLLMARAEGHPSHHAHFASLLIPNDDSAIAVTVDGRGEMMNGRVQWFRLSWSDGSTDEFWWYRDLEYPIQRQENFTTDASLIHFRTAPGGGQTMLAVDGTYLRPFTGESLLKPDTFVIESD